MLIVCAFVFGALIGSFLNVVIYRLPLMMERAWQAEIEANAHADNPEWEPPQRDAFNLLTPRSRCSQCGHTITALENIPLVSWVVLRGRCSACKTKISARYPIVELITGVGFALCAWKFGASYQALAAMALIAALVALTGIDLDTQLLPDQITLPLMWLGLLINVGGLFVSLQDAVIGAAAGYLILWSVYWLFKLLTGREGMGYGDFKLLAALGAWFGWQSLPMLLLISSVAGAMIGIALIAFQGKDRRTAIAFGPYLAIAGIAMLFIGHLLRL
ncbi:MAG: prepilin peptidase [Betaproteobacteria bacterium]|nr:MAG: prepilin peptidase [Betaproteobacteria bacterium]